ncbi:MAG TPA: hypothetical protein VNK52_01050 [Hyphomicrobiaceae bacterium]|nr:hypothetical protein [Hyphomicrobiaceae bacterium]
MYGRISKYREDIGVGVIVTDDGRKYRFSRSDVLNRNHAILGEDVDFVPEGNRPIEIIVMKGSPWTVFGAALRG